MTSWWERVRDQGVFVSQAVTGDVAISARLTNLAPSVSDPTYKWENKPAPASGLMIRESLAEKCGRFLLVQVEASGSLVCRWRDKTRDQDDNQVKELGKVALPVYLRLAQTGNQIQVFASTDGQNWGQPRMSHVAAFDAKARIGLFVCSGSTFSSATAVYDSITVGR
jgi:regulation of enolase protein 1 (concanavalin A-like superfamily)